MTNLICGLIWFCCNNFLIISMFILSNKLIFLYCTCLKKLLLPHHPTPNWCPTHRTVRGWVAALSQPSYECFCNLKMMTRVTTRKRKEDLFVNTFSSLGWTRTWFGLFGTALESLGCFKVPESFSWTNWTILPYCHIAIMVFG